MSDRAPGFYWVQLKGADARGWEVARWDVTPYLSGSVAEWSFVTSYGAGSFTGWSLLDSLMRHADDEFSVIGPRVMSPS